MKGRIRPHRRPRSCRRHRRARRRPRSTGDKIFGIAKLHKIRLTISGGGMGGAADQQRARWRPPRAARTTGSPTDG